MNSSDFPARFEEGWSDVSAETSALLAERLHDFGALSRFRAVELVRAKRLPFYSEHILCDVKTTRRGEPEKWLSCLYGPDGVRPLTGDASVIHGLNAKVDLDLTGPGNELLYLKFFCRFVHGADGPFEIVTSDDIASVPDDVAVESPTRDQTSGLWQANVLYGRALFKTQFKVESDGHTKMEDDYPVQQDVTRRPDVIFEGALRRLR